MRRKLATSAAALTAMALPVLAGGCGSSGPAAPHMVTLRLGYAADITQATALVGAQTGIFARDLGTFVRLRLIPFRSDAQEAAALARGQLDAAYASPDVVLATMHDRRRPVQVISGAAVGGSELVVARGITRLSQLAGKTLTVPSTSGVQGAALRYWLSRNHLTTGGSDGVTILPVPSGPAVVAGFRSRRVAGGWEPAPYDAEMAAAGGHVLAASPSPGPGGQLPAASLIVTAAFLAANPGAVTGLLEGQVQANDYLNQDRVAATAATEAQLQHLTGMALPAGDIAAAFAQVTFTDDPAAAGMATYVAGEARSGLRGPVTGLRGLYYLGPLNKMLKSVGELPVRG